MDGYPDAHQMIRDLDDLQLHEAGEIHESSDDDDVEVTKDDPLVTVDRDTILSEIVRARALQSVPAKSLLCLRAVSTRWNQWICNPFFAHVHAQHARSLSGVFFEDPVVDAPCYAPFSAAVDGLPDPSLEFLPEPVFVLASAYGLLGCRGRRTSAYYIVNPLTMAWRRLPEPARCHGPRPAVAIVMAEPIAYNFAADWFLVCVFPIADNLEGVYGVETFSSRERRWSASDELCTQGIETSSGVSAGCVAYWRTTIQTVVAYDPAKDAWKELSWPAGYEPIVRWEIGELGWRLCCVCVRRETATVYKLALDDVWTEVKVVVGLNGLDCCSEEEAVPIRVQGEAETMFLESGTVVARSLIGGGVRVVEGLLPPARCEEFVPYIATLVDVRQDV